MAMLSVEATLARQISFVEFCRVRIRPLNVARCLKISQPAVLVCITSTISIFTACSQAEYDTSVHLKGIVFSGLRGWWKACMLSIVRGKIPVFRWLWINTSSNRFKKKIYFFFRMFLMRSYNLHTVQCSKCYFGNLKRGFKYKYLIYIPVSCPYSFGFWRYRNEINTTPRNNVFWDSPRATSFC